VKVFKRGGEKAYEAEGIDRVRAKVHKNSRIPTLNIYSTWETINDLLSNDQ
jgi:hypothetical protein